MTTRGRKSLYFGSLFAASIGLSPAFGQEGPRAEERPGPETAEVDEAPEPLDEEVDWGAFDSDDGDEPVYESVVTARRPELAASSVEIPEERIVEEQATSGSELLQIVPGVRIVQHGSEGKGHQLFLRGFDAVHGTDVEILSDDVPLNEPLHVHGHGYVDLYGIIPETVRAIRVFKGAYLPWQGNFATAGSIRFERGVPEMLRPGILKLDVGHRGRLRGVALYSPEHLPQESYLALEAVKDYGYAAGRAARRAALAASHRAVLSAQTSLLFSLTAQAARWDSPGVLRYDEIDPLGFYGAHRPLGEGLSDRVLGTLRFVHETGDTEFHTTLWGLARRFELEDNYTGFLLNDELGDRKRQRQTAGGGGLVSKLEHKLSSSLPTSLQFGFGWRSELADQHEDLVDANGIPWESTRDLDGAFHHGHLYAGVRFSPFTHLELLPSVRGDLFFISAEDFLGNKDESETLWALSPRIAISVPLNERLAFFVDYGRGFRTPPPQSVLAPAPQSIEDEALSQYRGGAPQITVADTAELGVSYRPLEAVQLHIAGFGIWIENELIYDHVSNFNLELDGTRRLGVELSAQLEPTDWLQLSGDFTYVDARFNHTGHPIPGTAPFSGGGRIYFGRADGVRGGVDLFWLGRRDLAHGATASGYADLSAHAGWRFKRFDVGVHLDNLQGARIMDGAYHYASWFDRTTPKSAIPVTHYTTGRPLTARLVLTLFV